MNFSLKTSGALMRSLPLTLVSGPPGAGKTTWIRQQIELANEPSVYLNLGAGSAPIDATYLAAEMPELVALPEANWIPFLEAAMVDARTYVELGAAIDPASLVLPDFVTQVQRIAILPPDVSETEWHTWADEIVPVAGASLLPSLHVWRSALTGQVLDPASLDTFWYELAQGAYGSVHRAKAVFDVADGRSLYYEITTGRSIPSPVGMKLPLWLNGRPDRFSGLEVVGAALQPEIIAYTLTDCCLDDGAIAYYQQQIRELMSAESV